MPVEIKTSWKGDNTLLLDLIDGDDQMGFSARIMGPDDIQTVLPSAISNLIDMYLDKNHGFTTLKVASEALEAVKAKFVDG